MVRGLPPTFFVRCSLRGSSRSKSYIYIFDPLASVGYGDIFPRNIIERVVCHGMGQGMIFTMIGPWEKIFGGSLNGG